MKYQGGSCVVQATLKSRKTTRERGRWLLVAIGDGAAAVLGAMIANESHREVEGMNYGCINRLPADNVMPLVTPTMVRWWCRH